MTDIIDLVTHPERWNVITVNTDSTPNENKTPEENTGKKFQAHESREIMMTISGTYHYSFNGKNYDCKPGTVFLIDHYTKHECFYSSEAENLLHLWTYSIPAGTVIRLLRVKNGSISPLLHTLVQPVGGLDINQLWNEYNQASLPEEQILRLQYLKLAIAFLFGRALEKPAAVSDGFQLVMMEVAVNRIRGNLRNGVEVSQLARITGYSRFHFVRLFKQYTSGTVQDYINKCRLEKLQEMLAENRKTKEISSELGFRDVHSYYNWRRKYQSSTGTSCME